jgi:hypothetical protein
LLKARKRLIRDKRCLSSMGLNRASIRFASILFVLSILALFPSLALSQSYTTFTATSSTSSTYALSTVAQSVTTAFYATNFHLSAWHNPGCAIQVPFNAMPGDLISISFSSSVPLDFHIISAGPKYYGVADVFCGFGVPPNSLAEVASRTFYTDQWTPSAEYYAINKVTQYFLILDNWQTVPASVYLGAQETPAQMMTTTISATSTMMYTLLSTEAFNSPPPPTTTSPPPPSQASQGLQWQFLLAIIPIVLIALIAAYWRRGKQRKVERTRVY